MAFVFTTPSVEEGPAGGGPLFSRYRLNRGVTVLVTGGVVTQVRFPTQEQIEDADRAYLGGASYPVTAAERDVLVAAGLTVAEVPDPRPTVEDAARAFLSS